MIKNKFVLALLAILLILKFVYVPWTEWAEEESQSIERLSAFNEKQKQAAQNTDLLQSELERALGHIDTFRVLIPSLKETEKANALWFSLVDGLKQSDLKVYNQKVEFEESVTSELSYITGSFAMSGKAAHVIKAVLALEEKSPAVFLNKLILNRKGKGKNDTMIAQLVVGHWFSRKGSDG